MECWQYLINNKVIIKAKFCTFHFILHYRKYSNILPNNWKQWEYQNRMHQGLNFSFFSMCVLNMWCDICINLWVQTQEGIIRQFQLPVSWKFYKSSFNATQKHLSTSKRFQLIGQANTVIPKRNINMNAIFVSLLLTMAFAAAPTNSKDTRDRRQTQQQCVQIFQEKDILIQSITAKIITSCTESCSSYCASLLNSLNSEIGCCLESYGDSTEQAYINMRLQYCDIPRPELCN